MRSRPVRSRLSALAIVAALTVAATVSLVLAQSRDFGRTGLRTTEPTEAGNWVGTWTYAGRNTKMAIWIRGNKKPQIRLRFLNTDRGEGFQTDWNGQASYAHDGKNGTFSLKTTRADQKTIEADWHWELGQPDFARVETAKVRIYRAVEGRHLVVNFEGLERIHRGVRDRRLAYEQSWTFLKVSRRQAPWDELPF